MLKIKKHYYYVFLGLLVFSLIPLSLIHDSDGTILTEETASWCEKNVVKHINDYVTYSDIPDLVSERYWRNTTKIVQVSDLYLWQGFPFTFGTGDIHTKWGTYGVVVLFCYPVDISYSMSGLEDPPPSH